MSNQVALGKLDDLTPEEVARLPLSQIAELTDDADAMAKKAAAYKKRLSAALHIGYAEAFAQARLAQSKMYGSVRVQTEQGYEIKSDVPKVVTWDQVHLAEIERTLRDGWREDPLQYMRVERKVDERQYSAWPNIIKNLFDPARTVKPGTPKYELVPAKSQEAA